MGYKISLDQLFYINTVLLSQYSKLDAGANELYMAIENLVNGENFKGQTANTIKIFLTEVHLGTIMPVLMQCGIEVIQKFGLYYSDYIDKIDNDIHACFTEETFEDLKEKYKNGYNNMYGPCNSIKAIVGTVNDLVSVKIPSKSNVDRAFDLCRGDINNTRNDVEGHEKQYLMYLQQTRQFIDSIYELIKTYNSFDESAISGYKPGDINNMSAISNIREKYYKSIEFSTKYESEIIKSADIQKATYDQLGEERKDRAKAKIINGIVGTAVTIGSVAAIVLSGGTATPVVVASGSASGLYNISNTIEGFDSYKLAENGDVYSIACNPIRDTVFQGNQKVYDGFGVISSTVLSVKVIGAVSPDASVAYEFGKGIVIDKTFEFGKVNAIKLYESKTGNKLNETQKAAIQGIWDIGNTAKSLHDAKTFRNQRPSLLGNIEGGEGNRYLDFLKNGSNSGLTQAEIYGVAKVDSYTAEIEVGKIRHNTVEQNINSSMLGNIETSYGKSIENTDFYKENGGLDSSDYISIHSRKHMYNPNEVSTAKRTQYGKDVNVGKLCEDTIMNPDEVIHNIDQNVMIYKKEYPFNISTDATPTGTHRVFVPLNTQGKKTIRMSQFPLFGGN